MNNKIFNGMKIPRLLTESELNNCLIRWNDGDVEAKNLLIKHNLRLVIYIAKTYFYRCDGVNIDYEDLVMVGVEGLVKGVNTFDISKNIKLSTYVTRCINNEILLYIKRNNKHVNNISMETVITTDYEGNDMKLEELLFDEENDCFEIVLMDFERYLVREIVNELDEVDKKIIMKYYGFDGNKVYTQRELALERDISQSYMSRKIKEINGVLRKKLIKKGINY